MCKSSMVNKEPHYIIVEIIRYDIPLHLYIEILIILNCSMQYSVPDLCSDMSSSHRLKKVC